MLSPRDQHRAVYALTMRLQSLAACLRDRSGDGPELVEELKRCAAVALDVAEDAMRLAERLEENEEEERHADARAAE